MNSIAAEWRPGPSVCRCCLTEGCYKDISTEYFWMGRREVYAEMLAETFDLTIAYSKSTGPNSNSRLICEGCITRLRDASSFKRQVQDCERTFHQHLDPTSSTASLDVVNLGATSGEPLNKVVKVELGGEVKEEQLDTDDDMTNDVPDFGDDEDEDDDDLDNQPLTRLASRAPKKESIELTELIDTSKATATKRKSTSSKTKASPAKKGKPAKKEKTVAEKPEKPAKKKKAVNEGYLMAKRNAELIVKYTTAYPFRLPEDAMVCVYCCDSYDDAAVYREHMDTEHATFQVRMAFAHCSEGYIKVDCTNHSCRMCHEKFNSIDDAAHHLVNSHRIPMQLKYEIGLQPFKLSKELLSCAICNAKSLCLRQLSRHTQTHFLKYTCDSCGKSYATITALRNHMTYGHTGDKICRKCKQRFPTAEAKRKHMITAKKCWSHLCHLCGERFISWNVKQAHLMEVHGVRKKNYACRVCSEVFEDRKKYRVHFTILHTDDSFVCTCCGHKFETKRNLEEHRVVHTKEKLFPCSVCSKSFPRKKNLVQHMWIHSEYKRFSCDICNKKFNQRVSYKTHMRSYHPELDFDFSQLKRKPSFVNELLSEVKVDE